MAQNNPDSVFATHAYLKGDSLLKLGKYERSRIHVLTAAEFFEKNHEWKKLIDALNIGSEDNWRLGEFDKADSLAAKARKVSQTYLGKDHLLEADALSNLGNVRILRDRLSESLVYHEAGLKIRILRLEKNDRILSASYNNIGIIYDYMGDYDRALEYYQEALSIDEPYDDRHADIAMSYVNMGSVYELKGDNRASLKYYKKALELDLEVLGEDHPDLGDIYSNIGSIHYFNGSFDLAADYYEKGLRIREINFGKNHPKLADSYNNIGTVLYARDDLEGALNNHLKALRIREVALGLKHTEVISVFHNIAGVYEKKGETNVALKYYSRALELSKQGSTENHPNIAKSHAKIGGLYLSIGQLNQALFHLQYAKDIYKKNFGEHHPDLGQIYNSIGVVFNKKKQYSEAIRNYDLALFANSDTVNLESNIARGINQHNFLNSNRLKAEAFYMRYFSENAIENLNFALDNILRCDTIIGNMRKENLRHADKISLGSEASKVYSTGTTVSQLLFEKTQKDEYRHLSFYLSERNKGVALSQSLSDQYAKGYSGIPEASLEKERALVIDQVFYKGEILKMKLESEGYDTSKMNVFQNRLFNINRKSDSLEKSFEQNFPKYYQLKYTNSILKIEEIQKELAPSQVLIEYLESDSLVYVFSVLKNDFLVNSFPRDTVYGWAINQYLTSLDYELISNNREKAFEQFSSSAVKLYQILIDPVVKKIPAEVTRLIIVPDGKLAYVPWDIFLTKTPQSSDYKSMDYLINDYSVSYAHSASVLFNKTGSIQKATEPLLAFAPSYTEETNLKTQKKLIAEFRDELVPLKWNTTEVDEIQEYFAGNYLKGNRATEESFKQEAKNYKILHLAMHAFVDNKNPMLSKFVFTQNQDSIEDGMLHAYELFNMNLSAEMAVLSACKTGIGKIEKGEGVMSLGKAFSYAGCQSVVISHWSVDDKSTSKFMNSFYQYIAAGEPKDQAIRQAKLDFLAENHGILTHPYYWGGFVVLGNSNPLSSKREWFWLVLAIIAIVGVIARYARFRRAR